MDKELMWPAIHAYRKMVALGRAPEITCPDCTAEMVPVLRKNDEPGLMCFACRAVFGIGLHTWNQINANISELAKDENL